MLRLIHLTSCFRVHLPALMLLLLPVLSDAAISLDISIKADNKNIKIEKISAMLPAQDGTWIAIDSGLGTLTTFKGVAATRIRLAGSKKAFGSSDVTGIAMMDGGRFIISNSGDDTVAIIDKDGKLIQRLTQSGSDEGLVDDPSGLAWSPNQRLYIADKGNDRISVFGTDGVFIHSIGRQGLSEDLRLRSPDQVFIDPQERVYVLERRDDGIISIYSHDGRLLKRLTASDIKKMTRNHPGISAITVDDTGLLYLADNNNGRVYLVDWQQEQVVSSFGSRGEQRGQFEEITSLAVLPGGRLAVADSDNRKIEIYRLPRNARELLTQLRLPTVGYERDIKLRCSAAYRLQGGNVLCLDDDNDKVATFSSSGRPVVAFQGRFSDPVAASVDDQNVAILDDEELKIYRLDGKQRYKVGGSGSADGKLDSPRGVYLRDDKLYVADTGNSRIQIFSNDGIFLSKISNPPQGEALFVKPTQVVADSNHNLFVLEKSTNQVLVFSPKHTLLYRIGSAGEENSGVRFQQIYDIAVDADDNLYILCATGSNRTSIHVYNGPTKTISFGASSEQRAGMSQPVSLSIAPARKTVVSVFDRDRKMLLNYMYKQLPARVGGLKVSGDTEKVRLSWQKTPGSYISRYLVYAARDKAGPLRYVADVATTEAVIKHKSIYANQFYSVSAVSGFSVEGERSNVREDVFQAGYALYRDLKYEQALKIFQQSNAAEANNAGVIKYLGLTSLELDRVEDAVAYFRELSLLPGHADEGMNLQVAALVRSGDYVAAKAVVDKVIAADKATTDTIVYCGELSLMLGDAIGAVTCLEQALANDPDNTRAHFMMGKAYIKLGIEEKGLEEFKRAVAIDPDNAEVRYQSGLAYQSMGEYQQAVTQLAKAVELDAGHQNARLALARIHLQLKQYDQARTIAIKLAGDKDTLAEGQYLLGLVALATGENGQALLALNKATRADASNAEAWLALADAYTRMNQADKVRGLLVQAVEGDNRSFEAARRLGLLDYEAGDYAAAIDSLAIAAALKPDDYDVQFKLADSLFRTGAYKQANSHAVTASKLNTKSRWPLVLLANLSNRQGKNGEAIDYIKQAMKVEPNSADLHTRLGALYVENSLFDLARNTLEKAALLDKTAAKPHMLLGALYSQRRMFDEAIGEYDKAVDLDPSVANKLALNTAYAEKKKSMEFKSNAPSIVVKDLQLDKVFSAAYKQYSDKPIGKVRIQNTSAQDYGNLKLTFSIKGYMDFPATTDLPVLKANSTEQIELFAAFNNKVLDIDEDTGVQVEVAINFIRDGKKDAIKVTQPMTIYGKNAIVWGESNMVGSFVTPKDDTLRDFVRQAINENKPDVEAVDKSLLTAMTLFDVFGAHGIKYVVDPNSPYSALSETSVDYVQFGRETLKIKSGDCDDLTVLMSASLENMGIQTAVLDVPGHLLMMFNTGLPENQRDLISLDDDLLVVHEGEIWVPVEATMIGETFAEAWAEGARKYHKYTASDELKLISLQQAWQSYKPVTLKPANFSLTVPDKSRVGPVVQREKNILLEKSLDRLVRPYRAMVAMDAGNIKARMQIAIIYAKYGLYESANREFEDILALQPDNSAVYNNRGNIYFSSGDFERAVENYSYAEKLSSNDAGIKMNLSMAYYKQGDLQTASLKYQEAGMIDDAVGSKYAGYVKLLSH